MKIKTETLIGTALDWAVAKCDGFMQQADKNTPDIMGVDVRQSGWTPSTNWSQGGPIIERELLMLTPKWHNAGSDSETGYWYWRAFVLGPNNLDDNFEQHGPTPLIAAMRCFVASKLGDEIEIPGGLL